VPFSSCNFTRLQSATLVLRWEKELSCNSNVVIDFIWRLFRMQRDYKVSFPQLRSKPQIGRQKF